MGKFIQGFLAGILLAILGVLVANQCNKISFNNSGPGDTELVSNYVSEPAPTNLLEKQYSFAEDVLMDQQKLVIETQYIDAFKEISAATLQNVINMLLRNRPCITIKDIVNEYITNQNIYDNIQPNAVIDPGANSKNIITNSDTTAQKSNVLQDPNPVAVQNRSEESNSQTLQNKAAK